MKPIIAIPVTILLVIRAYTRKSLTPIGILAAIFTATVHALHPSAIPFTLLIVFFLLGTTATKVKHEVKATLTLSNDGSSGGEGPRTSVQVLANSGAASILILTHLWIYGSQGEYSCFGQNTTKTADLLLFGIVANYAAVAADTLSSELGILSKSKPVLITSLRTVPPGTNGGVSAAGLVAGIGGSAAIAVTTLLLLPLCHGEVQNRFSIFAWTTLLGTAGTLLDSLLGAVLQASVIDRRSGKIVEGHGGVKVLVKPKTPVSPSAKTIPHVESRIINSGLDILDNNQINFLMASILSIAGILVGTLIV